MNWLVQTLASSKVDVIRQRESLCAWSFDHRAGELGQFRLDLPSLYPHSEVWKSSGQLRFGQLGATAFAADDEFLLGELMLNEEEGGGLIRTSADAFRRMLDHVAANPYPHLIRTWSYFSAITHGEGEAERYKQFCQGRARVFDRQELGADPAATVIGRVQSSSPWLRIFWLASKSPGTVVDNPRQHLPRHYSARFGANPPRFSRAMLLQSTRGKALIMSGTASIVGEESQHLNNLPGQFEEACRNMEALLTQAIFQHRLNSEPTFNERSVFRVYVRDEERAFEVNSLMQARFPRAQFCVIPGEVCRRELLVEIEGVHHF